MGRRIDCYFDLVSPYSYVAVVHLLRDLDQLTAHGVAVDFHPMFLGAIMQGSGNKPPWTLAAKAQYLSHDTPRATALAGLACGSPPDLMPLAKTQSALRALLAIKAAHPPAVLHACILHLYKTLWTPPHRPLSDDAVLAEALRGVFGDDDAEVQRIMGARAGRKDELVGETQRALDLGAFGAPWLWVTNAEGAAEPFFGSDRFAQIYRFLGLPFRDVELLSPGAKL